MNAYHGLGRCRVDVYRLGSYSSCLEEERNIQGVINLENWRIYRHGKGRRTRELRIAILWGVAE